MIITATFIGKDYLGYKIGKKYKLKVHGMTIKRFDDRYCIYQSLSSFFSNWTDIQSTMINQ